MNGPDRLEYRAMLYTSLLQTASGPMQAGDHPNRLLLASLLAGQRKALQVLVEGRVAAVKPIQAIGASQFADGLVGWRAHQPSNPGSDSSFWSLGRGATG